MRRHPHPTDRRLVLLKATAKGHRIHERVLGPIFGALTAEAAALEDAQRVAAAVFLERVIKLMNEHSELLSRSTRRDNARTSAPRRVRGR